MVFKKGYIPSEEVKKKISKALKGKPSWHKGKQLSEEHKLKISLSLKGHLVSEERKRKISKSCKGIPNIRKGRPYPKMVGANNWNWKGGITSLIEQIRKCFKYRQWVSDIFTRDNFTCQKCEQRGGYLNAHHIKSFSSILQYYEITTLEEALDCEELWNLNNGITFCKECHKNFHKSKIKLIKERKANCNGMDN